MGDKSKIREGKLITLHGGYRNLLSFKIAQLCYDLTVRFTELYVNRFSRTKDQMIQAARSGVQNIAEGSQASATSKKTELKLTSVARASLEELKLDYEDYLRQNGLPVLAPDDPILLRFKNLRCNNVGQFRIWVNHEREMAIKTYDLLQNGKEGTPKTVLVSDSPCESVNVRVLSSDALVANGILSLINLASSLLSRQIAAQASKFETEGGFSERLYQIRQRTRFRK